VDQGVLADADPRIEDQGYGGRKENMEQDQHLVASESTENVEGTETTTLIPTPEELDLYRFLKEPTGYFMEIVRRYDDRLPDDDKPDRGSFESWLDTHDLES
jgi:hypothetical protein